jgi:glycosyltransferase involved in cell wall biosynthesis
MSQGPDLVLLTSDYPFGHRGEPLEREIEVLVSRFRRVYVLPSHKAPGVQSLPPGAELVEMPWTAPAARSAKLFSLASPQARWALGTTMRASGELSALKGQWRRDLDLLAQNVRKFRLLQTFVTERGLHDAIFYDYWFENSTLALAMLRRSGTVRTAVARAHRFDLYDVPPGQVPFRRAKTSGLDRVFAVSDHGAAYMGERVPGYASRISVQRLGVPDPGALSPSPGDQAPLVVTCAYLRPDKRIHVVPEVLTRLPGELRWVHFGDGPERARVTEAASRLPERISWSLPGHAERREIVGFYGREPVSALLSLSASEGLPVSMMEAQSYGIPIVACDVGGVGEIVNRQTGALLDASASPDRVAAALSVVLEPGRFRRQVIHANFQANFEAGVNYNRLADALIALHSNEAASDRPGAPVHLAAESRRP